MWLPDFAFILAILSPLAASAGPVGSGDLVVHAVGFKHPRGHAIAKLFLPGENVLRHGHQQARADIQGGEATFTFPSLPYGNYAVVVFHDENDNGEIDHGALGPKEPIGFSNGFRLSLVSGLPTFEKLKFAFGPEHSRIEIRVR
jgi:uncharacterized protein (DUF2141 family)